MRISENEVRSSIRTVSKKLFERSIFSLWKSNVLTHGPTCTTSACPQNNPTLVHRDSSEKKSLIYSFLLWMPKAIAHLTGGFDLLGLPRARVSCMIRLLFQERWQSGRMRWFAKPVKI